MLRLEMRQPGLRPLESRAQLELPGLSVLLGQRVPLAEWQPGQWLREVSGLAGNSRGLATKLYPQNLDLPCIGHTFRRLTSRLRQNRSRSQCCLTEKSPLYECL